VRTPSPGSSSTWSSGTSWPCCARRYARSHAKPGSSPSHRPRPLRPAAAWS